MWNFHGVVVVMVEKLKLCPQWRVVEEVVRNIKQPAPECRRIISHALWRKRNASGTPAIVHEPAFLIKLHVRKIKKKSTPVLRLQIAMPGHESRT